MGNRQAYGYQTMNDSNIEIDREAIEASKKDKADFIKEKEKEIDFRSYMYNGVRLDPTCHLDDAKIYMIDYSKITFPEWNPDRAVVEPTRFLMLINS